MVDSKQQWKAWIYLAPAIVLLLVFTVWPIFNTVRMAFLENYSGLKAAAGAQFEFGLGNFLKVLEYKRFLQCLKNTCLLCVLTVPISTILALLIAVALNSIKFLQKGLQTIFFLPYVTNSIAIGMVFAAMFNIVGSFYGTENELIVTAGIINNVIEFFGGTHINWINYGSTYAANMFCTFMFCLISQVFAINGNFTAINGEYACYSVKHGRFTCTVTTNNSNKVARFQVQAQLLQSTFFIDGAREESFRNTFNVQHLAHHLSRTEFAFNKRHSQSKSNQNRSKEFQIVRRHTHLQYSRDYNTINNGT